MKQHPRAEQSYDASSGFPFLINKLVSVNQIRFVVASRGVLPRPVTGSEPACKANKLRGRCSARGVYSPPAGWPAPAWRLLVWLRRSEWARWWALQATWMDQYQAKKVELCQLSWIGIRKSLIRFLHLSSDTLLFGEQKRCRKLCLTQSSCYPSRPPFCSQISPKAAEESAQLRSKYATDRLTDTRTANTITMMLTLQGQARGCRAGGADYTESGTSSLFAYVRIEAIFKQAWNYLHTDGYSQIEL